MCNDVQLGMGELRDFVRQLLEEAETILSEELCFGAKDLPEFDLGKLRDNWNDGMPGASFATNPNNSGAFEDAADWFPSHLRNNPGLGDLLYTSPGDGTQPRVNSKAARQYEDSVQRFLECMLILLHIGSGQPARRPELMGLRWRNVQADKRNLFLHEGLLCFILFYHKSLNMLNASRYPVRFLLPTVGRLLARFLILIQPVRAYFHQEVRIPETVSDYLWHDGQEPWCDDRLSDLLRLKSRQMIGVELNVQTWRQIAVGIAIQKFSGVGYNGDFDIDRDEHTPADGHAGAPRRLQEPAGGMPEVLHRQASHNARTGNSRYGGTINYNAGLTNAGLQEYRYASQLWHDFIRGPFGSKRHAGGGSMGTQLPLAKRLAVSRSSPTGRRAWSAEEALCELRHMYGAVATYRSRQQAMAIGSVIRNEPEIIAVLSTGEGKSLLYLLPSRLPASLTTVLIVPLVALKQDTVRRCHDLGVVATVWDANAPPGPGCPLLIVSLDQAVGEAFLTYLFRQSAEGRIGRIVVDEAHLIVHAGHYRRRMQRLKQLRTIDCQFICLTATLPRTMMDELKKETLLSKPLVFRSSGRKETIAYRVQRLRPGRDMVECVAKMAVSHRLEEEDRGIVFTRTTAQADALAVEIGCNAYHSSSGSEAEKLAVLDGWYKGEDRWLVGTSAFGLGVDHPYVRVVLHVDEPWGAIDFAQESGRLCRGGGQGVAAVILPANWRPKHKEAAASAGLISADVRAMQEFLDSPRCRRTPLSSFLDGEIRFCDDRDVRCDRCRKLGLQDMSGVDTDAVYVQSMAVEPTRNMPASNVEEESTKLPPSRQLLKTHNMRMANGAERFKQTLKLFNGHCAFCLLLGVDENQSSSHATMDCSHKFRFFDDKNSAGGRWMAFYTACFGCGLIQSICPEQGQKDPVTNKFNCTFRDIVVPLCWALFQGRFDQTQELYQKTVGDRQFDTPRDYFRWLGESENWYERQSSRLMRIAEGILNDRFLTKYT